MKNGGELCDISHAKTKDQYGHNGINDDGENCCGCVMESIMMGKIVVDLMVYTYNFIFA